MSIPTFTVNLTSALDADDKRAILDILTSDYFMQTNCYPLIWRKSFHSLLH